MQRTRSWSNYDGEPIKMMYTKARLALNPNCLHSRDLFIKRSFSVAETTIMRELVNQGDIVIDIGANLGFMTAHLSTLVGSHGRVLAFEPDPTTYGYLLANLRINRCDNFSPYNIAMSDEEGLSRLFISKRHSSDNRMYQPQQDWPDEEGPRSTIDIDVTQLDTFADELDLGKLSFIKIDVQGYEYLVLKGASRLIKSCPSITVLMEFTPSSLDEAGSPSAELWSLCEKLGLQMSVLDEYIPRLLRYRNVNIHPLDRPAFQKLTHQLLGSDSFGAYAMLVLSKG